jgi:branched-chain amino acid transport system permease protein
VLFLELLLNGILLGSLYTCIGVSFSLIWGVMNLINLAHGTMIMLGAYVSLVLFTWLGWSPFLSIPVSAAVLFLVGYGLQRYLINLVVKGSIFMTLILTFAIDMLLINLLLVLFTADTRSLAAAYAGPGLTLGEIRITGARLLAFGMALALTYLLHLFLTHTRLGNAIKATSFDPEAAQLVGVEIRHIFALTFGIGAAMAGASGPLLAMTYSFSPVLGGPFTMKAFVVVVLGGLGSIPGAVVAGFTLGIAEHLSRLVFGSGYQDAVSFLALLAVLVARPTGLFGKRFYAELKA